MQAGAKLATRLEDPGAASYYWKTAHNINESLVNFWIHADEDAGLGYWQASIFDSNSSAPDRAGLDCALPLTVIHAGQAGDQSWTAFDAGDAGVLATMRQYINSFEGIYDINNGSDWTEGWAVGRYMEDVYDGVGTSRGHPWFAVLSRYGRS
jgi:glucoamylase